MLEKLKDFFYNISDLIVALLIIAVAAYIISWKVEDIMNYPSVAMAQTGTGTDSSDSSSNDNPVFIPDDTNENENNADEDVDHNADTEEPDVSEEDVSEEDNVSEPNSEPTQNTESEQEVEEVPSQPVNKIQVDIPSGSPGIKIASILRDEGLIDSTSEFIDRLEERKLDSKLRAGEFKIPDNASLDEVIDILTGQ